jgi:predicted phage-related endonuclease
VKCIEDINVSHLIQCQWQMMVTGLKKCHLGIFGPMVSDYQRFEIAYDEALAMELLAQAKEWWERHIIQDVQPEPINTEDALLLWPVDDGSTIEAVPSLYEAISQYKEVNEEIRALTKRKDDLKDRITPAIGGATVVKFAGMSVATYKHQIKKEYTVKASETRVLRT